MGEPRAWERQADEGESAYAAARLYFELGPGVRSQKKVAAVCEHSPTMIARWSKRHNWTARAKAYDVSQAGQRAAAEQQDIARVERETANALFAKAGEMLAEPLEATRWNWRDAVVLAEQGAKLAKMAAEAAERVEQSRRGGDMRVRVEYVGDVVVPVEGDVEGDVEPAPDSEADAADAADAADEADGEVVDDE